MTGLILDMGGDASAEAVFAMDRQAAEATSSDPQLGRNEGLHNFLLYPIRYEAAMEGGCVVSCFRDCCGDGVQPTAVSHLCQ